MARRALATLLLPLALALAGCSLGGDDDERPPQLGAKSDEDQAAAELGFPFTATKNTVRVGGGDAISDVAGVANLVYPATSEASRPAAVVLVDKDDWQGAVAASVLAGTPIGAPLLLSDGGELPAVTTDTLERLDPKGSDLSKDAQVIRIGSKPPSPSGRKSAGIGGKDDDEFEIAAAIDRYSSTARGEPSGRVLLVSGERAEYALPAAPWAARSGDSVLFTKRDELPEATRKAIIAHEQPNVYVLGPETVISTKVTKQLKKITKRMVRIQGPTPVQNAIEFARYSQSGFGWGVTVPGHNFTLASTSRPLDAAAAASLGTNGVFAPLLLTDDPKRLPRSLESYLLDVQPGFEDDPGLAVFNRVWILGDDKTISLEAQGRLDEVTELIPVELNQP